MADVEESIFLRDASLESEIRAALVDVPTHPDRILVERMDDPADPEWKLVVHLYPTTFVERDEWIAEVRERLADQFDITEAPTGYDLESLELAPAADTQRSVS